MQVHRCEDARAFLAATQAYREREPLRTNVLGSVATSAAAAPPRHQPCYWWTVDDGDGVVGAAIRTVPFVLGLGPMPNAAARALAPVVAATDDEFPAVGGFGTAPDAFLAAYAATATSGSRRVVRSTHSQLLYAADTVTVPEVPGEVRVAGVAELDAIQRWYLDFTEEVDGVRFHPSDDDHAALRETVSAGRLRWWWRDGAPVAMAGHAEPVVTPGGVVTRVGPVYTPPTHRRRGYAAALTGQLTELLLARGSRVMLYADEANPTSNGVYARLGYRVVDRLRRVTLAAT